MSWSNFEYSVANGQPVTLYQFQLGDSLFWRYTNADRDINVAGQTWAAQAISNSGLSAGGSDGMDITLPSDNPVALLFRSTSPSRAVRVQVMRWHANDESGEFRVVWIGEVTSAKREQIEQCKLITVSLASTFSRVGLRLTWGRQCPYALYDHNCRVNPQTWAVHGAAVTSLDGSSFTASLPGGLAGDWFSGGFVEFDRGGFTERRGLRTQDGNRFHIFGGTSGMQTGQTVTLYPGCDRTISTCSNKFSNHLNYGGQPHMPGQSPYTIIKLF
ncbi:phage BR0599 family protein [Serratia marcescens]